MAEQAAAQAAGPRRGRGERDGAKERHWRRMIQRWERSGRTVRDFCTGEGVAEPSFYAWRRELAKRDRESASCVEGLESVARGATHFLPVQVLADETGNSGASGLLEVQLPTGVRLRIPAGFDARTLSDVLSALAASSLAAETRAC